MSGPIDALYTAGFDDEAISTWAVERRSTLAQAGFKDNEIDAYFTGGVVAPERVPEAVDRRLAEGAEAKKREGGLLQTIPQGVDLMMSPEGRGKLWEAVKAYPYEFIKGMLEQGQIAGDVAAGKIDLSTEEGMEKAIGLGTLVGFGRLSKTTQTGRTSGFSVQAWGDQVARIDRGPMGEIYETPIGGVPTAEDFSSAAKVIGGPEAPLHVQEKLLRLYEDDGRLPAEVAHDAQTDPVLAQRLLSKDQREVPFIEAYHGSPHDFEAFDVGKIGTGEGAQSYGHGLYFAENKSVAETYKAMGEKWEVQGQPFDVNNSVHKAAALMDEFNGKREFAIKEAKRAYDHDPDIYNTTVLRMLDNYDIEIPAINKISGGNEYQVRIHADRDHFLDWDKPLSEQTPVVREALSSLGVKGGNNPGSVIYDHLAHNEFPFSDVTGGPDRAAVSNALRDAGISGIKYRDQLSRGVGSFRAREFEGKFFVESDALGREAGPFDNRAEAQSWISAKEEQGATQNFVLFDDKLVEITHKNGEPVTPQERRDFLAGKEPPKPPVPPEGATPSEPPKPPPGSFEAAQQKVLDKISVGERDTRGYSFRQFYREFVDDLYPLKAVEQQGYEAARLTRGDFGKASYFLEVATFDHKTLRDNGAPLSKILEPVRDDLDGWRAYAASRRAIEVEETGRKSGFDVEAAKKVIEENPKAAVYEKVTNEVVAYNNRLLEYLKDAGMLTDRSFDAMVEAGKSYLPFYRLIQQTNPNKRGSSLGPGDPVKRLKGSERETIDPLESIIKNTYAYVSIAERNAAGIKIVEALEKEGLKAKTVREGAGPELSDYLKEHGVKDPEALGDFVKMAASDDTISAYREGKRVEVPVDDPELVKAFKGLDRESAGIIEKVLGLPASWLRAGAVLNPEFIARNPVRDMFSALVFSSRGLFTPADTAKGLIGILRRDADWQDWVKSGGANAAFVSLDRRYMQESLQKLTADTGLMTRSWNVVKSPLTPLRMFSELMENATRVGEFKKVLRGVEDPSKGELQSAAYSAREVTLDFARLGAKMRSVNMIVAFANAQVQGVDRLGRAFIDRPVNTSAKILGGITLPSALLWWANHEDERYKELPDWQRDLFWIVPTDKWEPIAAHDAAGKPAHLLRQKGDQLEVNNGAIFRIPKPFELGVIFGSGVERALSHFADKDPESFKGFTKSVMEALTPGVVPTAALPIVEQFANRSSFTNRTLIPADVEKQLPEYQYTPYTTELAKKLGKIVASFPGLREQSIREDAPFGAPARGLSTPVLIENYIRSWSGGLGMYALNAADAALRKANVLPDPITPTPTLADIPFVKAFVVRYPSATAESIQGFYDDYTANKRYFDTFMAKARDGDIVALKHLQDMGGPMMFAQLDGIKETLTEHSKLVRDVYKNPSIPAEEKRQLIDQLYYSMIKIGQYGKGAIRDMRIQSEAMTNPALVPLTSVVPLGKSNGATVH